MIITVVIGLHMCYFQVFYDLQYNCWLFEMCPVLSGCDYL